METPNSVKYLFGQEITGGKAEGNPKRGGGEGKQSELDSDLAFEIGEGRAQNLKQGQFPFLPTGFFQGE